MAGIHYAPTPGHRALRAGRRAAVVGREAVHAAQPRVWGRDRRTSEREAPHAHVDHQPEAGHQRHQRGASIAEERQRDPDHGQETGGHPQVDRRLPEHVGEHAEGEQRAEPPRRTWTSSGRRSL